MKILALETVEISASVALLEDTRVIREKYLGAEQRSGKFLTPAVMELLEEVHWNADEVDLITLPTGPGSFTGLRVGITFAKTFAYVTGAEILGFNTLDILAAQTPSEFPKIAAVMDAQRNDVITRTYTTPPSIFSEKDYHHMTPCDGMRVQNFNDWLETLSPDTAVTGSLLKRKQKYLPQNLKIVPEEYWSISLDILGKMAYDRFQAGQGDSLWEISPIYSRLSAAEERKKIVKNN
ncbi:MAG: tRNA (adenosine(37)-N6)-threonylcarbamoyltransferase complex dimerization subunit type 1 TsaB [Planctomycetia bacterium]|nr:tRNA (adenosine(37)-N6)-threonylcarbamoyltransferase complex dimerization subunit type 1 TsaB [Planctomycetia bacterium]